MSIIIYLLFSLWCTSCEANIINYIITERASLYYLNLKYWPFTNITSFRHSRADKFYYVDIHFTTLITLDNKIQLNFYFFEFLSNQYKRSFIEMHYKWCDLLEKDAFFGAPMKQGKLAKPCPHMPGDYHLYNMTVSIDQVPNNFPFTKGRIFCNSTYGKTERLFEGSVDMEIRSKRVKQKQVNANKKALF